MDDIITCDGGRIAAIDSQGLIYRDEEDRLVFLNFSVCHGNWLRQAKTAGDGADPGASRCVGERNAGGHPAHIDLYADPVVRFIFPDNRGFFARLLGGASASRNAFRSVQERIVKAGWSTRDVS